MRVAVDSYLNLGLNESLHRTHHYPLACKELSFILTHAYFNLPSNVRSLLFDDALCAFRLLPQMQTHSAFSAAYLLHQSAKAVLPKQKRILAVAEFKHAKAAYKRCCKAQKGGEEFSGSAQLPQDVLVHIFSFLDIQSLASAALVCWSWNSAASENSLWQSLYSNFFGSCDNYTIAEGQESGILIINEEHTHLNEDVLAGNNIDWRDACRRAYIGDSSKRIKSYRGFCGYCNTIVWLSKMRCSNRHYRIKAETRQIIRPLSLRQIVEYILAKNPLMISSSESDSDSDSDSESGSDSDSVSDSISNAKLLWSNPAGIIK